MKKQALTLALASIIIPTSAYASDITTEEVEAAQAAWGNGIVEIGKAEDPKQAAIAHIDKFYGFDMGSVLFKPTLASEINSEGPNKKPYPISLVKI